jgi:predicted  nucleic acid-binding Zn-ribbon protein
LSKGKFIEPHKRKYSNSALEQQVYEIIFNVIPTFEIEVENEEWEKTDDELKDELTEIDNQIKESIESIEEKVSSIEKRLGSNEGNLSDEFKKINMKLKTSKKKTFRCNCKS